MPPHTAARGLRRTELITSDPSAAVVFHEKVLGWLGMYAENGFECWVGERHSASIRTPQSGEAAGWRLIFAGGAQDSGLTGPGECHAELHKGRAQHGPWAPAPRVGEPCWIELVTDDSERADHFWSDTLCWGVDSGRYTADGRAIGMRTRELDLKPGWLCYFGVDDFDGLDDLVAELGGRVLRRWEHPVLGESLLIADPIAAVYGLTRAYCAWGGPQGVSSRVDSSPNIW